MSTEFARELTNLTTGKFIDVVSSGPVLLDFHPDGAGVCLLLG
jgi:hypothetical protein